MLTQAREKLLDVVLGKEEAREAAKAEYAWKTKVARLKAAIEEELTEDRRLAREVDAALKELRGIEPAYKRACAKLGHAKREYIAVKSNLSQATHRARGEAEAAAPQKLDDFRRELVDEIEQTRRTQIQNAKEPTGDLDRRGKPRYRELSNHPALATRMDRLRALVNEVDLLKVDGCEDLDVAIDAIRRQIPPADYPLS